MYKSYSMELAGRTLTVDIGRVGQALRFCFLRPDNRLPRPVMRSASRSVGSLPSGSGRAC